MGKKISTIVFVGITLSLLAVGGYVMAASGDMTLPPSGEQVIDLKDLSPFGTCGQLDCILVKIMDLIFYIAIPLTSIMVLWGGFQILTAGGDPEKVKTGGKTVLYSAIGFAVVLVSRSVVSLITDIINQ